MAGEEEGVGNIATGVSTAASVAVVCARGCVEEVSGPVRPCGEPAAHSCVVDGRGMRLERSQSEETTHKSRHVFPYCGSTELRFSLRGNNQQQGVSNINSLIGVSTPTAPRAASLSEQAVPVVAAKL